MSPECGFIAYRMPPLDWTRVMGADLVALEEDPDAADDMYTVLESVGKYNLKLLTIVVFLDFEVKN